jgi:hypothetical protein
MEDGDDISYTENEREYTNTYAYLYGGQEFKQRFGYVLFE